MNLDKINLLSIEDCARQFETCCTAQSWLFGMADSRPYNTINQLFEVSDKLWSQVDYSGWIEACEGHPKIGDVQSLAKKFQGTLEMAGNEQSGMDHANQDVIERLAEGNQLYENKFGYIFIVFATGKSAREMCELLEARLPNPPEKEEIIARAEQHKITTLRLKKMLALPLD